MLRQTSHNKSAVKLVIFSGLGFLFLCFNVSTLLAAALNDTGISDCADNSHKELTCPQVGFTGQDAEFGRDISHNDPSNGYAGFDFTKIHVDGSVLADTAASWTCVRDNVTGLMWEVKTNDGGLRDKDWTYTWYSSNSSTNGGNAGTADGGSCDNSVDCDTEKYISRVNSQNLCGQTNWRLPSQNELLGLRLLNGSDPTIDNTYFINTKAGNYLSASSFSINAGVIWVVKFGFSGQSATDNKSASSYIRLVRGN